MNLPDSWNSMRLGEVLQRSDERIDPRMNTNQEYFYVGLENIESHSGRLVSTELSNTESTDIQSIKTVFQKNDILYGRLRPNLNKVWLADRSGICSTELWALQIYPELTSPDFTSYYLRSPAIVTRTTQFAAGANLPRVAPRSFDRIPISFPTLLEQERILEILNAGSAIFILKQKVDEQVNLMIGELYFEYFSKYFTDTGIINPIRISKVISGDVQYGVSESTEETGDYAVLRMNGITKSGWLNFSDLKYTNLSSKDAENTKLLDGDILFNRTNSKELVGKCAIWREKSGNFSFASYLFRIRLKPKILPEYFWATLNSSYGKYRLQNAAKQAVSMANVSPVDLRRIQIPLPTIQEQQNFAQIVREIEKVRLSILGHIEKYRDLLNEISYQAFSGELTAGWREEHLEELIEAAKARDTVLNSRNVKTKPRISTPTETPQATFNRSAREWLIEQLSEFQREVWNGIQNFETNIVPSDSESFETFQNNLNSKQSVDQIHRVLEQLTKLGLIARVSVQARTFNPNEIRYVTAYRALRTHENTRLADADLLVQHLERLLKESENLS